ncbi:MAG: SCP2 sterol-binding domain-containing protein [Lachnospiraceae bacterium]|nr:SCP2 sterol-binding domain-containing protein [Lachnospiraceae bacterium]
MKINIYYGGRGIIDDPTLYVIGRMARVFEELNVRVEHFNLYELKNGITTLSGSIKDADGIVLASTVEWYGVGGLLTQFLDALWLYGNKEKISNLYMMPVAMSTTYGERDGMTWLSTAWEILGGLPCDGLCGYIAETSVLESDPACNDLIEKKAENFYRSINQKLPGLPNSNQAVKTRISLPKAQDLTPQESEQLSQYASDESYVQTQKEDIQELTNLFRSRLGSASGTESTADYPERFRNAYHASPGVRAAYYINLTDLPAKSFRVIAEGNQCSAEVLAAAVEGDVSLSLTQEVLENIVNGRMTFQRAFMAGSLRLKGDFTLLRQMDSLFPFLEAKA